jgi:L,D-peptidoglycan transpeptidase YkuD (ErfK/YbiS/YcfS/YnhG family)
MMLSRRALIASAAAAAVAGPVLGDAPLDIVVTRSRIARLGRRRFRCALGRAGIVRDKREGDGGTPAGAWPLREVLYRPDRLAMPVTKLPVRALEPHDGWCDAPGDARYNRLVRLPYPASAEQLWRGDHLYDLIVVVGYNDAPVVPGKGSAIFLHLARSDYAPTAGCVAFARPHLLSILSRIDVRSRLIV